MNASQDLENLARRWGIERRFFNALGEEQEASAAVVEALAGLLERAGAPAAPVAIPPLDPAFQGDGRRHWILAVQLYGVRSGRNWGHGDFADLAMLLRIAADAGAAGIGLNPLHALFLERAEQASPYAPNSRNFLNPLYVDVEAIPGHSPDDVNGEERDEIARLRETTFVDYEAVAELKTAALRRAFRRFSFGADPQQTIAFETFRQERGEALRRYACFETYRRINPAVWWDWPSELRRPQDHALRDLEEAYGDEVTFHQYVQWVADAQLQECRDLAESLGLPIGLYLDLAVGVDAGGADAWSEQDVILPGLSVGAPPDFYNVAGQDWGLTTFSPHGLAAHDFQPLRTMLRSAMRHAGAIRLDHVLGLMRLYVIPWGFSARDGVYLLFPFESMLAVIADESRRHGCIVIGEDLGTVPPNFRETTAAWGLWSYLVMLFEREGDGSFRPAARYPDKALATLNTHDMATYRGWISGADIAMKRGIGVDPGESDEERERSRTALAAILGQPACDDATFDRIIGFLAATPARLVSVASEDVLEMVDQINVPGTSNQYPNWRSRWPMRLEDFHTDPRLQRLADIFRREGRTVPLAGESRLTDA